MLGRRLLAAGMTVVAAGLAALPARGDSGHAPPTPPVEDDSLRFVDPDTYATPDHPAYDYYRTHDDDPTNDRTDLSVTNYLVAEQFGCHADHPYMRWLLDATRKTVAEKYATMRDAMADGFTPLSPVPNDFGYPDTYWHWWNQLRSRPRWQDRLVSGAPPRNDRDWLVQPDDLQHLLLVPAYWEGPVPTAVELVTGDEVDNEQPDGEPTDGWVTAGVMYATEHETAPELYPGCAPFHSHGTGIDTPHFHLWLDHHVHPMAMNPPHLCDEHGQAKPAPYGPLDPTRDTSTWTCMHGEHGGH